jgi:hypothetical protein
MNDQGKPSRSMLPIAFLGSMALSTLLPAGAVITPDAAVMSFDDLGLYVVGYAYRGQPEERFPLGWTGGYDDRTGVTCAPSEPQNGRHTLLMHCPWKGGTGITFQQFEIALPRVSRILLRGAAAMRSNVVGLTDGSVFRVFAGGRKLLETLRADDVWQAFEFDLTEFAETTITIRFEVDPGPHDNSTYDHSLWGDRELVLEGFTPAPIVHPVPRPLALSNVLSVESSDVAPPSGFQGTTTAVLLTDVAVFTYQGPDGLLEYRWERPAAVNDALFGEITLTAQMTGQTSVTVPLANSANVVWTGTASPVRSSWEQAPGSIALVREFRVGTTTVIVRIAGRMAGKSLTLSVTADQPLIQAFDAGAFGPVQRRQPVTVPYYSDVAYFLPYENLFANAFLDWTGSAGSSHDRTKAQYQALTNGSRNRLKERVVFAAAWHLAEVFPNIPNPPSPYRAFLADKIVLDIWGGNYSTIGANLEGFADFGITKLVALVHNWQRSGYDNALPMHIPANPSYGGDTGMKALFATANRLQIPVALHENYVDYYPNYDFYDTNDIARDSSGNLILAWYNPGTQIQSFAVKPNAILRLAGTQSPEIHTRYGTQANYLDVHSAVAPWFHVDFRAGETGAGMFQRVWDVHRQLWAYERTTHQGPVFGEGAGHWYWSGCLDGVEAQFTWSAGGHASANQGMTAPLNVDFDLLKVHPLQFNHGMGYYERWWSAENAANFGSPAPMVVLDQYRMQEVAFGHAGFLGHGGYLYLPLVWLEHHLLPPVTARYATARPTEIFYEVGGSWVDATAAVKAGSDSTNDRVRVTYEGGLVITANSRAEPLPLGSRLLPRFGWLAEADGISAGTVVRDGIVVDFADTRDTVFANARSAVDWNLSTFRRVRPTVASFQQTAARTFRATYRWEVEDRLPKDYHCFVHFTQDGTIRWQQDHAVTPGTLLWQPGQVISDGPYTIAVPVSIPDGDYDWLIGLFDLISGERVRLRGVDDGTQRIRLGVLHVRASGAQVVFEAETGTGNDPSALYREHLNEAGSVVDFGDVRTDGSVYLRREGGEWILKTWPRERNFTLEFSRTRFGNPAAVRCSGGPASEVIPVPAGSFWRLPLNGSKEYRWTADTAFRRGDVNGDGDLDIADPISFLSYLFVAGSDSPACLDTADANDDGELDIADAVTMLLFLFGGSGALGTCDIDRKADDLDCLSYEWCSPA